MRPKRDLATAIAGNFPSPAVSKNDTEKTLTAMNRQQSPRTGQSATPHSHSRSTLERLQRLAWLLDSSIRLPGGFRIGIEAILGLIPFVGDVAGVILSAWIVTRAARLNVSGSVLARMLLNIAIEGLVGLIPFVGDVFDAFWKANQRNVNLLARHVDHPGETRRASRWFVGLTLLGLLALLALLVAASLLAIQWLWRALSGAG